MCTVLVSECIKGKRNFGNTAPDQKNSKHSLIVWTVYVRDSRELQNNNINFKKKKKKKKRKKNITKPTASTKPVSVYK